MDREFFFYLKVLLSSSIDISYGLLYILRNLRFRFCDNKGSENFFPEQNRSQNIATFYFKISFKIIHLILAFYYIILVFL